MLAIAPSLTAPSPALVAAFVLRRRVAAPPARWLSAKAEVACALGLSTARGGLGLSCNARNPAIAAGLEVVRLFDDLLAAERGRRDALAAQQHGCVARLVETARAQVLLLKYYYYY